MNTPSAPELYGLLVRFVRSTAVEGGRRLATHGITAAQLQVLQLVAAAPGCSQREVSDAMGATAANTSMLVSRLVRDGLLERRPVGPAVELGLTPAGRRLLDRVRPEQEAYLEEVLGRLRDTERRELARLLRRLDST